MPAQIKEIFESNFDGWIWVLDGSPVAVDGDSARTQLTCHFVEEEEYEPVSNADALV